MADINDICIELRALHRERMFAMEQRKRGRLSLLSFLRLQGGYRLDLSAAERTRIAQEARDIVDAVEKGDVNVDPHVALLVQAALEAMSPWDRIEETNTKRMVKLVRTMDIWDQFGAGVRGFGEGSLATIIGEAGNLSHYPDKAKLWKRMGVAVMGSGDGVNDVRQGNPGSGASADLWIEHGYSKVRRSRMFVIGDVLMKIAGPYRDVYLARKAYENEKARAEGLTVAPSAKIPAKEAAQYRSEGHIHRRSQRYMEKRLLRDLLQAWHRCYGVAERDEEVVAKAA